MSAPVHYQDPHELAKDGDLFIGRHQGADVSRLIGCRGVQILLDGAHLGPVGRICSQPERFRG